MAEPRDITGWVVARAARALSHDDEIQARARQCVLDWLGVLLSARGTLPPAPAVRPAPGEPSAVDYSAAAHLDPAGAAFANAAAAHVLDFDDCHNDVPGHASVTNVAAALAVAESASSCLGELLDGVIAGVEATALLGSLGGAEQYARGWHPTATLGAIGSAVAAATVRGLGPARIRSAVALAALQSSGSQIAFGTLGKSWQVGCAARNGVVAAEAAANGYEIAEDVLGGEKGVLSLLSGRRGHEHAREGHPRIADTIFKYYATCFATHAAIECAQELSVETGFSADRIERVRVFLGPQFAGIVDNPQPRTQLQAKFSATGVVALTLCGRPPRDTDFLRYPEASSERYLRLEERSGIVVDPQLQGGAARVELELVGGESRMRSREEAAPRPVSEDWGPVEQKFLGLAGAAVGEDRARELVALLRHGERERPVSRLAAIVGVAEERSVS